MSSSNRTRSVSPRRQRSTGIQVVDRLDPGCADWQPDGSPGPKAAAPDLLGVAVAHQRYLDAEVASLLLSL